ncbi:MAG: hypothetical protein OXG44_01300 [Gammaproteobacteria bacterium]|nr:hypothetical protein [Gammaproteobacteria bacterium]
MNQLALFPGKSEGPPARPPVPLRSTTPARSIHDQKVCKEDTTITRKRKAPASPGRSRHKIKTIRTQSGRYRYLVLYGTAPLVLSREEYAKVGDAKSAGKAKARELEGVLPPPMHVGLDGYCHQCLQSGQMVKGVTMDNAGTPGVLCKACWEERHPGLLQKWGVA